MSFFTDASFVMDPNVYGVGKLYVPKPTDGSGDLTFSRASTGTRVNQDGLIEKVRTNVLLQSNSFDTTWTTSSASVTGGQSGYDGSSDAWLLESTGASGSLRQSISSSAVLSYSFYAKAGNVNYVRLRLDAATETNAWFLLSGSGSVGTLTNGISSSIESVGGGWYRVSVNANATSLITIRVYPSSIDAGGNSSGNNVYIQNAQLETGDIATDYIATTTAAVSVGPVANVPRLDYLGSSCPRLLLEPQRTNAFLYSNQPEGTGWDRVNCTLQTGFAGPDGYNSARKFTATSNDSVFYYQNTSVTSGTSYTASVYVKSAGKRYFQITGSSGFAGNEYVNFDLQTGTIVYESGSALTGKIEALTDGWYRVSVTQIATSTTSGRFILALIDTATAGRLGVVTADGNGILVWEHQMEASSYPTSIIPTLGSAVTRLVDSAYKTGISSLIGQSEGTLYWEGYVTPAGGWNSLLSVEVLGAVFINLRLDPSNQIQLGSGNLSSDIAITGSTPLSSGTYYKIAGAYKSGQNVLYVNGVQIGTSATTFTTPTLSEFRFNVWNVYDEQKRTAQALLFKTRLSNDTLARLTSL
jgi:hypothetical protein